LRSSIQIFSTSETVGLPHEEPIANRLPPQANPDKEVSVNSDLLRHTLLALLGLTVGMVLHLRWHPVRRHLSDAWDFMRSRQVLVLVVAGGLLLNTRSAFTLLQLQDWRDLWLPLTRAAFMELALLPHALISPWPMGLALPLALLLLTIRVWRWPYRYGERVPVPEQKLVLLALCVGGVGWLALELASWRSMLPEAVESVKTGLRLIFTALMAAGTQVWLVRLVIAWEQPPDTESERDAGAALESTFARWQAVVMLAGFNLLWMAWRTWRSQAGLASWLLPEMLLVCAALPLAVAAGKGPFWQRGALALQIIIRASLPLISLGITALALLILVRYAADMAQALSPAEGLLRGLVLTIRALAQATLSCWLTLAALFVMLRHGLR